MTLQENGVVFASLNRLPINQTVSIPMAKKNTILLKLVSTAGTGYYYVRKRNPKKQTEKLALKKYDPVVRKHVEFKEQKLK